MKKLFLIVFVLLLAFVLVNRQRIFVRDPLAKITRNGVPEHGTQIFINYSNDVLLENDNAPAYITLIQRRAPMEIGAPLHMKCFHWMACMMDGDPASLVEPAYTVQPSQMTSKVVTFRDSQGRDVQITLR